MDMRSTLTSPELILHGQQSPARSVLFLPMMIATEGYIACVSARKCCCYHDMCRYANTARPHSDCLPRTVAGTWTGRL